MHKSAIPVFLAGCLLAACQTNEAAQNMAAINQISLGALTTMANLGVHGRAPAVAGAVTGAAAALTGAAALAGSPSMSRKSGAGAAGGGLSGNVARLPDTAACTRFRTSPATSFAYASSHGNAAAIIRHAQEYHDCLNSTPNHPHSRAMRCGPGKYYVDFGRVRACGMDEVRLYAPRIFN